MASLSALSTLTENIYTLKNQRYLLSEVRCELQAQNEYTLCQGIQIKRGLEAKQSTRGRNSNNNSNKEGNNDSNNNIKQQTKSEK